MIKAWKLTCIFCALAAAMPAAAQQMYRYVDANGKVHYSDKPLTEATGKPIEQLNKQGTVVKRTEAALSAEQIAALEAEKRRKADEEVRLKEEKRKNMALLNTYSSERDIDEARGRALKQNEEAIKEIERRIGDAQKRQAKLQVETEFYAKKPLPAQLKTDMQNNELEMKAQQELLDVKKKEVVGINAKYDEDRRRFLELTAKPAPAAAAAVPPTATAAATAIPAAARK